MGGVLVIGTIDHLQLKPVKGLQFILSPLVPLSFRFRKLSHSVRGGKDPAMVRFVEITRIVDGFDNTLEKELHDLLANNCTFVGSWEDPRITDDALRIFARKEHVNQETNRFLQKKKIQVVGNGGRFLSREAEDTMAALESHSEWQIATELVSRTLDKMSKEPRKLCFFKNAFYQFTFNKPGHFSNSQLGVLLDVPSQETLDRFLDINIWVAPPTTRSLPLNGLSSENLVKAGWIMDKIGLAPQHERQQSGYRMRMKRKQYGLKHHVGSTIHKSIGFTVSTIATQLDEPDRRLWERAQSVVAMTRTCSLHDVILVGDKERNIRAIVDCLRLRDQYTEYMTELVEVLSGGATCRVLHVGKAHPFRPKDAEIPQAGVGVVYVLISAQDYSAAYIGHSLDLRTRIARHNTRSGGSKGTAALYLPGWNLLAYVEGFDGNTYSEIKRKTECFEFELQSRRNKEFSGKIHDPRTLITLASSLTQEGKWKSMELVVHDFSV